MDKIAIVHLLSEVLPGCEKEENFILCDSMDGPGEHYAKLDKAGRERQIPYGFIHMWSPMNNLK